jgi:stress response protein SCP2
VNIFSRGQKGKIADLGCQSPFPVVLDVNAAGMSIDLSCFGLDSADKLSDERFMVFYNQLAAPGDAVKLDLGSGKARFAVNLDALPQTIVKLVFVAAIDGNGSMRTLGASKLSLGDGLEFPFSGADFADEKAVIVGEIYRKDGVWRFGAVGQGFNGGLDALVAYFGASVAASDSASDSAPVAVAAPASNRISLEKRIQAEAPQLVNLVKQAGVSLQKVGLDQHRAKVALVLDISGSMGALYRKGLVQQFAERILALGCKFDDDGEIDVFLFGSGVHQPAPMSLTNAGNYVQRAIVAHPLEGDTRYGRAMEAVRKYYFPDSGGGERSQPLKGALPVYVMFVTDGTTSDKPLTEKQLRWASHEPIFWQFMGIGKGKKSKSKLLAAFADSDFPFLEKLDELSGRFVDNADFFSVASPDEHADGELYDLLMTEYPSWLKQARQLGLLA